MVSEKSCISREEIEALRAAGQAVVILDVRSEAEFAADHIEGALHLPLDRLSGEVRSIAGYALVVTACGKGGGRSAQAAELLAARGLAAKWLCGGTFGWN